MRSAAPATTLVLALSGCFTASGSLEVSRAELPSEVAGSIVRLEVEVVAVRAGAESLGCDEARGDDPSTTPGLEVVYDASYLLGLEAPEAVGHLSAGRYLFVARARSEACAVVARGCSDASLRSGEDRTVTVTLRPEASPEGCEPGEICTAARCGPCSEASDCDDGELCTRDECRDGRCVSTPYVPDADGDGHGTMACGGDDCDDGDRSVYPGAPRRCGAGRDHDCDGIVDDRQGCGVCAGASGLTRVQTLDTPAVGLFALGPDESGAVELFVSAAEAVEVYRSDDAGRFALVATSRVEGTGLMAPQVVGDHTLVPARSAQGAWLFDTDELRAGGAEPLGQLGGGVGVATAFLAGSRMAYISLATFTGSLATVDLSGLPAIDEPVIALGSDRWRTSNALEAHGGWLFGMLGQSVAFAELDPSTGAVLAGSYKSVGSGYGSNLAVTADHVLLAQGDYGLLLLDREELVGAPGAGCCEGSWRLPLPTGCTECENATGVDVVGPDRAVVMTFSTRSTPRTHVYLVDISDLEDLRELAAFGLSNPAATGREVVVRGGRVYVAARVEDRLEGVVEVLDLGCR